MTDIASSPSAPAADEEVSTPLLPVARGPVSDLLLECLTLPAERALPSAALQLADDTVSATADVLRDDDVQLSLFLLYALHYGSLPALDASWEWDPELLRLRGILERAHERAVRAEVPMPELPEPTRDAVSRRLFDLTAPTAAPGLSRFVAKRASLDQAREFLVGRTIYTLREADPHSWAIPRLTGRAKVALVEIQTDEYGAGDPTRMHAEMFARTLRGVGLDARYGAYLDDVAAIVLANHNTMSMFGLHRRLRGAVVGHLAAFEMTSSIPNRSYGDAFRRLGFGADVTDYFDEHVAADAVHEQIAGRDLAGALAEDEPGLLPDIFFGAAACLHLDDLVGAHVLDAFEAGRSSLRRGHDHAR